MVTDKQKANPQGELGDTGVLDKYDETYGSIDKTLNINQIKKPGFINWIKRYFEWFPRLYRCKNCDRQYKKLPTKKESRFDCQTKGCYWMIFSDGTQTYDGPGE